ncbi:MAG: BPL-N domain-containing protein, partial [Syntrophales bacterium]|nr:BPL-N domain-containing protein [Syntrophales bacterium]
RRALIEAGLPFDLLRASDILTGGLSRFGMVFIPGGWAANKLDSLGSDGQKRIRNFVEQGGSYLGICGGAGLATEGGLALLPVKRTARTERVPSFSGPISLRTEEHVLWRGIEDPAFHAWWPSQFREPEVSDVRVLARYDEAGDDACSADVKVPDGRSMGWDVLEERYGMFMDPARLLGEPAVLEGRFGKGRVILSLIHFDTPGDPNGRAVLRNLWHYLASCRPALPRAGSRVPKERQFCDLPPEVDTLISGIQAAARGLITAGEQSSLWKWRNPLLLHWRRGVRGLEYSTLAVMIGEIAKHLLPGNAASHIRGDKKITLPDLSTLKGELEVIRSLLNPFVEKAARLISLERNLLETTTLSPVHCADDEINRLRQDLFGPAMSHGGSFKTLIVSVDRLFYRFIR